MAWNTFEHDRPALERQYEKPRWIEQSGLPPEALSAECLRLLAQNGDLPRELVKAKLLQCVLQNAQLALVPEDFFADQIQHSGILLQIRNAWLRTERDGGLSVLIEENETPGTLRDLAQERAAAQPLTPQTAVNLHRMTDDDRSAGERRQAIAGRGFNGNPDFSHAAPAWEDIFELGLPGLLDRLRGERAKKERAGELTQQQAAFYEAGELSVQAVVDLMLRYARLAERLSGETGSARMALLARTCGNLASRAPQTLLEALQLSVTFYTLLTFVEGAGIRSLGYLDRLLIRFYREDLRSGRYTCAQLKELLQHYFVKFQAMKVLANTPFTLCSLDRDGNTVYNELTDVLLDTYGELNIHDPKIQIRCSGGVPDAFLRKALALIVKGNSSIVFMNDDVVVRGLCALGEAPEDARGYIPVGCYEPMALGTELPCSCNGRINIPKAVELAFTGGVDMLNGDRLSASRPLPESWPAFYETVLSILQEFADRAIRLINGYESVYPAVNPAPLFSATYASCVQNGLDAYAGGAKYNNSSINIFGLAEAVDSMLAVKKAVFEQKLVSFQALAQILRDNWAGQEKLRLLCKNKFPHYGNGEDEADTLAAELAEKVCGMINGRANARGGVYRCGGFSIDACEFFGEITAALPDGRLSGEMLSKNMCAVVGADREGVTTLIRSVTKIDYTKMPNGTVLDVVLHESAVHGEDGMDAMLELLKTYLQLGGLAIHFNVLDPAVLRQAQLHPEQYSTLQIRLCGWNVYFVNLNRKEQDSFIQRAELAAV